MNVFPPGRPGPASRHLSITRALTRAALLGVAGAVLPSASAVDRATHDVLVVLGAAGTPEFAEGFSAAGAAWRAACEQAGASCTVLGGGDETDADTPPTDKDRLHAWLQDVAPEGALPAWIVYVGHGTFNGREARLNLRGPDVSVGELQQWLGPLHRPIVVVHGGSASGPFLPALSAPGRIVITATESGDEVNYARFGERFATAITNPEADIDQDGQTTVLEAFLSAAQQVDLFYTEAGRMASEHALLDDNGDKRGTPPDWFRGTRAVKRAQDGAAPDGSNAHRVVLVENAAERALTNEQRLERDRLEQQLEQLRTRREKMTDRDYLRELEIVLRQLSAIYVPATTSTLEAPGAESTSPAGTPDS